MATVMVRISVETHKVLQELAQGETMQSVIAQAIEDYRRKRMFERANAAYAALRQDPEAWADEVREREEWEATLADDLGDD